MDQQIDAFLQHVATERGLAPRTLEAYGADLLALRDHLEAAGVHEATAVTPDHIRAFLQALERRRLSARSASR